MPRRAAAGCRPARSSPLAGAARAAALSAALSAAGCVTTYQPFDEAEEAAQLAAINVPLAIPFPDIGANDDPLLRQFYDGIVRRLQGAADDGDWRLIDALVDSYDRPELPPAIGEQVRGYRGVARGIVLAQHMQAQASLRVVGPQVVAPQNGKPVEPPTPPLGESLRLELRIPAANDPVLLGGGDDRDAIAFTVAVTIEDDYGNGSSRSTHVDDIVRLPMAFALRGDNVLTLPIDVDAMPGDAVRRTVYVRVDLMPGHVVIGDMRSPVRRVTVAAGSWTQLPVGYEVLAREPLRALQKALRPFSRDNFAAAYLAAIAAPPAQRDQVVDLLIDQIRHGDSSQAQVAMAALREVTGAMVPIGDRDTWLAWYQTQLRDRGR